MRLSRHLSLDTLFCHRQKSALCSALAIMVAVCALMIAIPGLSQALLGTEAMASCHDSAQQSLQDADLATSELHENSATTVCSGDTLNADRSAFVDLLPLLGALLVLVVSQLVSRNSNRHYRLNFRHFGPPFQGQLRSHLALRRIHI